MVCMYFMFVCMYVCSPPPPASAAVSPTSSIAEETIVSPSVGSPSHSLPVIRGIGPLEERLETEESTLDSECVW